MSVDLIYDLWTEFRRFMSPSDRVEAADILVAILIDNDYDVAEIRAAFRSDLDVRATLNSYIDDSDDISDDDDDDEEQ
jgi:hypothetical protein